MKQSNQTTQKNSTHLYKYFKKHLSILAVLCLVFSNLSVMPAYAAQIAFDISAFTSINSSGTSVTSNSITLTGSDSDLNNKISTNSDGIHLITNADLPSTATSGIINISAEDSAKIFPFKSITFSSLIGTSYSFSITFDSAITPAATVTVDDANNDSQLNGKNYKTVSFGQAVNATSAHITITQNSGSGVGVDTSITEFVLDNPPELPVTPAAPVVTADDTTNKIVGADATMEYSTDNGVTYVNYDINNVPTFVGAKAVLVRVMASGINPAGDTTALSFTNAAPIASDVTLSGNAKPGNTITAAYIYSDSDNDEQGNSIINWYLADNALGTNKTLIEGANSLTYKIAKADQGKYIIFEITPVASTGELTGTLVSQSIKVAPNVAPVITNITLSGDTKVGSKITAKYGYHDADNDLQGASVIKWYNADNSGGKNKKLIAGASGLTYTVTQADEGKCIIFEVTPKAQTGIITGKAKSSSTASVNKISHMKLGLLSNKSYANALSSMLQKKYHGLKVTVKKEGKNYRVYADFADKTSSEKAMKDMKSKKYISNYSYIN